MPTRPHAKKPVRPIRKPIKPVKPMGLRPVVIVLVIALAVILGATAYYFFKGPPVPPVVGQSAGHRARPMAPVLTVRQTGLRWQYRRRNFSLKP